MNKSGLKGNIFAVICVIFWGTSFIASKKLMACLTPSQLMWLRFVIAYAVLWILCPKWFFSIREELLFLQAALFSNTLYFLAENTALTLTQTSNVSILVTTAPVFTAVILALTKDSERITKRHVTGFAIAFIGVVLVVLNGMFNLKLSPKGDMLALLAALFWAVYSVIIKNAAKKHSSFLLTRKLMFYGILTATPLLFTGGRNADLTALLTAENIFWVLYLGLICSALCYILWNSAIVELGVLNSTMYIYAIPVVTLIAGSLLLGEKVTVLGAIGIFVVIAGLVLSSTTARSGA